MKGDTLTVSTNDGDFFRIKCKKGIALLTFGMYASKPRNLWHEEVGFRISP
ncbi:MAG: anti-sigma factor domain-containing protein [Bacteroidota bacterium]